MVTLLSLFFALKYLICENAQPPPKLPLEVSSIEWEAVSYDFSSIDWTVAPQSRTVEPLGSAGETGPRVDK